VETKSRFCALPPEFDVEVSRKPARNAASVIPGQVIGAFTTANDYILDEYLEKSIKVQDSLVVNAHWADAVIGIYI
jgi:hypothetical protein